MIFRLQRASTRKEKEKNSLFLHPPPPFFDTKKNSIDFADVARRAAAAAMAAAERDSAALESDGGGRRVGFASLSSSSFMSLLPTFPAPRPSWAAAAAVSAAREQQGLPGQWPGQQPGQLPGQGQQGQHAMQADEPELDGRELVERQLREQQEASDEDFEERFLEEHETGERRPSPADARRFRELRERRRRAAALAGETPEQRLRRRQRERLERERHELAVFDVGRDRRGSRNVSAGDRSSSGSFVDRSDWQVTLTIEEHDHAKGTVSGSMRAVGGGGNRSGGRSGNGDPYSFPPPTPPHPPVRPRVVVRTWWTGEVVDNANFSFLSNNHGVSSGGTDVRHWLRFRGWGGLFGGEGGGEGGEGGEGGGGGGGASAGITRRFVANGGRSTELAKARHVYLRIKEEFFVTGGEPGDGGSVVVPPAPVAAATASAAAAAAAAAAASPSFDPSARQRTSYSRAGLSIAGFYYLRLCRATGRVEGLYFDPSAGSPFQKLELAPAPASVRPASACHFDTGRSEDDGDDDEEESGGAGEWMTEGERREKAWGGAVGAAAGQDGDGAGASDDGGASAVSSFAFN